MTLGTRAADASTDRAAITITRDLEYANAGEHSLQLDLYVPETPAVPSLAIYIHGGGFRVGDKGDDAGHRPQTVASLGLAVASVNYRLRDVGHFPDQVHDIKAAIRWLRGNAASLGVDASRIGLWGSSAGAILAALTGLTSGDADLEGDLGDHCEMSTDVQCVVFWSGAADLVSSASRSELETRLSPATIEAGFLGLENVADDIDLARQASPLTHVRGDAPPFLIAHGDRDRLAIYHESAVLHDALTRAGAMSTLITLGGAGHEDARFDERASLEMTAAFLRSHLQ
ncbi:alpha/beta hydrolase [Nocardioides sp. AN3]